MSKYQSYKSSNIDWIGEIPSEWKIKRLKQNTYLKGRIGWQNLRADEFVDEGPYCITGTDFKDGIINWKTSYRVTEERYEIDHNIHLEEGDLIITKDGTIGKVARVENMPYKATLNSGIMLIRPTTASFHTHFLYWILNSEVFFQYNEYTKSGSTILHLYQNVFERMPFPVPTIYEQTAIANYLDEKTTKLDQLISNKKAQIEKLKEIRQIEINTAVTKGLDPNVTLKPSGIEWLGDIPIHWELWKLSSKFKDISSGTTPQAGNDRFYENGEYPWINTGDLNDSFLHSCKKKVTQTALDEHSVLNLHPPGVLIMAMYGATIGKLGITSFEACCNQACCVIGTSKSVETKYLFYWLMGNRTEIVNRAYGGGQPNISQDVIKRLRITCPPSKEQTAIANYLDEKTSKLDQLVSNLENQIEQLQEVRKIEIYNAVTGKIKIA